MHNETGKPPIFFYKGFEAYVIEIKEGEKYITTAYTVIDDDKIVFYADSDEKFKQEFHRIVDDHLKAKKEYQRITKEKWIKTADLSNPEIALKPINKEVLIKAKAIRSILSEIDIDFNLDEEDNLKVVSMILNIVKDLLNR